MAQALSALVTNAQEAAHRRAYNHGCCYGCGRAVAPAAGRGGAATYVDISLTAGVILRYHPRCAPPVERWMRATGLRRGPLMGTHTVVPACALVDRHEDFITPVEIIALLHWTEATARGSRRVC